MIEKVIVRRGSFLDSVALMAVSRSVASIEGVADASVVNATPLNVELIEAQGFSIVAEGPPPGPNDLLIAVRAGSEESLAEALELIEARLRSGSAPGPADTGRPPARSLETAVRWRPEITVASISVPGSYASYECARALDAGLDVFCFSSGPGLEQEAALKSRAAELGLLMMGPDCGTAILNGVSFGFANALRRGPVGIVGASGTGIQAVGCRLDAAGVGVSQALGTGGRDLSGPVGGSMTLRAVELLGSDPATETIVIVAKSPDREVARRVAEAASATGKSCVLTFPGLEPTDDDGSRLGFTGSLEEAASSAAASVGASLPSPERRGSLVTAPGAIRGLFSGGTLRDEAWSIVGEAAGELGLEEEQATGGRHALLDLGDERYTTGRPHPMIDPSLRIAMIEQQALEGDVGTLLLDVVLGYGAHPDPASELGPAIERAVRSRGGNLSVVVSLCGAEGDPQGLDRQVDRLVEAGAIVTRSNADAARLALDAAGIVRAPS